MSEIQAFMNGIAIKSAQIHRSLGGKPNFYNKATVHHFKRVYHAQSFRNHARL
jgi:hypothetical protein